MVEYTLDENGQIKHVEKMDKEYYEIYTKLQSDIKEAVKKMDTIYSTLYAYECFILGKHTARNGVAGISPPRREFQKC